MNFAENLKLIREKIDRASGNINVKLIGVTKTFPAETIRMADSEGLHIFGENRMQEAIPKIQSLSDLNIEWHFIGHLQTNKARDAVRYFSWIQSVDSVKLLHEIEKQAAKIQKKMNLLLEVNLGDELSKHGFAPEAVLSGLEAAEKLHWSRVIGFMVIPPFLDDPEQVRPYFQKLREMRQEFSSRFSNLNELSMGMSHDYEVAAQEGATMVRIGTALFGSRP